MTRIKQQYVSMSHLALLPFAVLALAFVACGGEETATPAVEVGTVVPTPAPTTVVRVATATDVPVAPEPTPFGSAEEAYKAGDFRSATRLYREQVAVSADDGHAHYMLGLSSWKAGDFEGAKLAFDRAIELSPRFAKAYFNQGRVLLDLGRVPEALEVIETGRTIDSTSGEGLRLVARAKAEGGDVEAAIATYRELLSRDENDVWGLNNLGMLYLERGDVESALGPLARAVQVRPTAPLFLNNLGMALERSGYPVAALRRYELAVQHDSGSVKALRNVERLKGVVTDGAVVDEVSVSELAEAFRLTVRGWKMSVAVRTP